jgi:hypothetical protein
MNNHPTLCLHVPVSIESNGRTLSGELYLPRNAQALRICILHGENAVTCRRLGALLTNDETATLTLHADGPICAGEMIGVVDWVRSRRLLQSLAIKIIAPPRDAYAVKKAAMFRPVAVSA